MSREKRYWGYRIDKHNIGLFWDELQEGRLRQGWGWFDECDLRLLDTDPDAFIGDGGVRRNRKIFESVKEGDILLVPQLPDWDKVAVVRATKDWDVGYDFDVVEEYGDFGHIFPAEFILAFVRNSECVDGDIRATLRTPVRFWNIDGYKDSVEKILNMKENENELQKAVSHTGKVNNVIKKAFSKIEKEFGEDVCEQVHMGIQSAEWESVLVDVLKGLYPGFEVENIGGPGEIRHGTDILMTCRGPVPESQYGIAIQIKDYEGSTGEHVIDQIDKADTLTEDRGIKIIEKVVVLTKISKKGSTKDELEDNQKDVKFIWKEDLEDLIGQYARKYIGRQDDA